MGATGRNASQYGRIIENRMIEAIEVSATQLIEGFRPLTDTGGYDWVGAVFGRFDSLKLLQFKGTLHLRSHDRAEFVQIIFDAGALTPHRNTSVLFGRFDIPAAVVVDPLSLVPALDLNDLTIAESDRRCERNHLPY